MRCAMCNGYCDGKTIAYKDNDWFFVDSPLCSSCFKVYASRNTEEFLKIKEEAFP